MNISFGYSPSTGTITIPAAGYYRLAVSALLSFSTGGQLSVYLNGSYQGTTFGGDSGLPAGGTTVLQLAAGDVLQLVNHFSYNGEQANAITLGINNGGQAANMNASLELERLNIATFTEGIKPSNKASAKASTTPTASASATSSAAPSTTPSTRSSTTATTTPPAPTTSAPVRSGG